MSDLALIWLSTGATVLGTVVAFIVLALWSAGEPVTWSIVPGLARGVGAWAHRLAEPDPMRFRSPRSEEPGPPIDLGGLPLSPIARRESQLGWRIEELPVDPATPGSAEVIDLGARRIPGA